MQTAFQFVIAIGALVLFVWMLIPRDRSRPGDDLLIDPDDARQMGLIAGLMGGSVVDAAVMRYALQRFEQQHGRRATMRDIGTVIGLTGSQS